MRDIGEDRLREALEAALATAVALDGELFFRDVSERCLAARIMLHLQPLVESLHVDVEFNRQGHEQDPKRLGIDPACANKVNENGHAVVIPDLIVHRRGKDGPNYLVVEVKKTTNRSPRDCDTRRVQAYLEQLEYQFGATVELETRDNRTPSATITQWFVRG